MASEQERGHKAWAGSSGGWGAEVRDGSHRLMGKVSVREDTRGQTVVTATKHHDMYLMPPDITSTDFRLN